MCEDSSLKLVGDLREFDFVGAKRLDFFRGEKSLQIDHRFSAVLPLRGSICEDGRKACDILDNALYHIVKRRQYRSMGWDEGGEMKKKSSRSIRFQFSNVLRTLGCTLRTELGASLAEELAACTLVCMGDLSGSPVKRETEVGGSEGALDLAGVFKASDMALCGYCRCISVN